MPRLRPLFHPRLVKLRLETFDDPDDFDDKHATILRWIAAYRKGALDRLSEVQLHGDCLKDIFSQVLGYRSSVDAAGEAFSLKAEQTVSRSGKFADAALGFFDAERERIVCPVELKGVRQNLDSAGSRALTPVEQAFNYANHSPGSRFVIVSNYREFRLYSLRRSPDDYEVFFLEKLEDKDEFRRFLLLLSRESLLGTAFDGPSLLDDLLQASEREEVEITRKLYEEYKKLREDLYQHLRERHSNQPDLDLLRYTQTILDRTLFVAFAEDRGLLPEGILHRAATYRNPFQYVPIWQNFVGLFRSIDQGHQEQNIHGYNGGLFRNDPDIDALDIGDEMVDRLAKLGRYDFYDDVSVEVLGHIFEQSIADLEELRAEADSDSDAPSLSKRKAEGVFYTPSFITRYLVEETLGRTLRELWEKVLEEKKPESQRGVRKQKGAWESAWEAYRDKIREIRVLDPACGSGAFLVAAFDRLAREYERVNASLAELRDGQIGVFDLNKTILNNNLYGVDLNRESIEITKLSLWLKTAMRNRTLTDIDRNIKWGNSVVSDSRVDPCAFDWKTGNTVAGLLDAPETDEEREIDARWREGFDIVVGNPPYIRQELLGRYKEHWKQSFGAYHGMADIFVYFFERGIQVLREEGRLGFIVTNKWFRAGYAENMRGLLAEKTKLERIVDFGHAPIFQDADTHPSLIVCQKLPSEASVEDNEFEMTSFPRSQLGKASVEEYVENHRHPVPQARVGREPWSLEPPAIEALMDKIREAGPSLIDYAGTKPYRGVLTGFNKAFLIDTETKNRLIDEDSRSEAIIKKFLRGQDIARWAPEWDGQWMIFARRGIDIDAYPAVKRHLEAYRKELEPRPADWQGGRWPGRKAGRYKWFEIQDAVDYHELFEGPKIIYQVIQHLSAFALDDEDFFLNDKGFFLPTDDAWLLAALNSPLMWWHNWRHLPHMLNESLTTLGVKMEALPIAEPSEAHRELAEKSVPRLVELAKDDQRARRALLDSLRFQFEIEKPGQKLSNIGSLDEDEFIQEAIRRRPRGQKRLSAAALVDLRALHEEVSRPMRARARERAGLEATLSKAVNEAYGLSAEEVALLWDTAPPRMPGERP